MNWFDDVMQQASDHFDAFVEAALADSDDSATLNEAEDAPPPGSEHLSTTHHWKGRTPRTELESFEASEGFQVPGVWNSGHYRDSDDRRDLDNSVYHARQGLTDRGEELERLQATMGDAHHEARLLRRQTQMLKEQAGYDSAGGCACTIV